MKKFFELIIILVFLLATIFYFKDIFLTEEGKIKRVISQGERAIEKKDIVRCASFVSLDYSDSYGLDRRSLIVLGEKVFREYQNIFIHIESLSIELNPARPVREFFSNGANGVKDDLAEVKFIAKVMVSRPGEAGKSLSIEKGSERFTVTFRKEEGKWKVFRAEIPEYRFD